MNYLEFARTESASLDSDLPWLAWCRDAEDALGVELDGDELEDGYSLDGAFDAYRDGQGAMEYVETIKSRPNFKVQAVRSANAEIGPCVR